MGGTIGYSGIIIKQEYLQLQLHILFVQSDPQSKLPVVKWSFRWSS